MYFLRVFFKYLFFSLGWPDSAIDIMDVDFFPDSTAQDSSAMAKAHRKQIKADRKSVV